MDVRAVVFWAPKAGNDESEWEDGAGGIVEPNGAGAARYIVVDGATEAYDSIRWVDHLVTSFVDTSTAPQLRPEEMGDWFVLNQRLWLDEAPPRTTYIEERKFAEGSFATLLCCELAGLHGIQPRWRAAALGDAVMFQVRAGRLIRHFPPLTPEDFGTTPDGVHTDPEHLGHMMKGLQFDEGPLAADDLLYLATDALAEWMLRMNAAEPVTFWRELALLQHPMLVRRLFHDHIAAGSMTNDDVTLVRLAITSDPPTHLVSCLS